MPLAFIYLACLVPIALLRLIEPSLARLLQVILSLCLASIVFWGVVDLIVDFRTRRRRSRKNP